MSKVLFLQEVVARLDSHRRCLKAAGGSPAVVLAHGCFDVLHLGHVWHLQAARKLGSLPVVTVTADRFVGKGPGRPIFSQEERAEMLAALACVDFVAVNEWPTAINTIALLKPALFVKGSEYRGKLTRELELEEAVLGEQGGRLVFTETPPFHTTELLEKLKGQP